MNVNEVFDCSRNSDSYLRDYAYPICEYLHSHNWEEGNKQQGDSAPAHGIVSCIISRYQQSLSKLVQKINGTDEENCRNITKTMRTVEDGGYRECGFCFLPSIWKLFDKVINISIEFNKNITPPNKSPDISNTLIPKLIEVCTFEHARIKSVPFHDNVDFKFAPEFEKMFNELSEDSTPEFNFKANYSKSVKHQKDFQEPYATPCYILKTFFKDNAGMEFECYDILLYTFLAFVIFPLLSGILLHLIKYKLNLCLERNRSQP